MSATRELERDYLLTQTKSAEIQPLQGLQEVILNSSVGRNSQLEGTGFNLSLEMSRLIANYNQNLKDGKNSFQALMLSISELEVNIRTFVIEYIQTRTVLPHVSRLSEVDGRIRMVGQNGVPVVSGITDAERSGATLMASVQAEEFLTAGGLQRGQNRAAVINSPLGHSGLISEKGTAIRYKNNQTMISWTDEKGGLRGLTIVSDLNKEQSRQLSISLGVSGTLLAAETEEEEVANIVANPALFSYGRSISDPAKYVFEKILDIRGNSDIKLEQEDGTIEYRSVAQTRVDIENCEALLRFSTVWEGLLKKLKEAIVGKGNALNNSFIQAQIAAIIEETILEITVDYLQKTKPQQFNIPQDNVVYFKSFESKYRDSGIRGVFINDAPDSGRFAMAAAFLKTRGGCNGGGGAVRASLRGVSLSSGSGGNTTSILERGSDVCPDCEESNMDNHYHCPDCKKKYADETDTERTAECGCGFVFGCGPEKSSDQIDVEDEDKLAKTT